MVHKKILRVKKKYLTLLFKKASKYKGSNA